MSSDYVPFQILTAEELNASFDGKTDNADAKISGGYVDGVDHITVVGVTPSVTPTSGALIVTGGVGIGQSLNIANQLFVGKEARVLSSLAATSKTTGALTVAGGVGIGGDLYVNGISATSTIAGTRLISTDATQATSPATGAVTTAGGLGVAKDAWIGGALHVQGAFSAQGGATLQGDLAVDSIELSPGGSITFGDGTTQSTKPMDDAAADGSKYGRKDNAWVILTDLAEAPSDGVKYARRNAAWVALTDVPDAPNDAFWYGRHQQAWAKVTEEAPLDAFIYGRSNGLWAKSVPEAPTDGQQYSRRNGAWQVLSASGLVVGSVPPADTARFPMWWDNVSGTLYIWYDDGNSAQWVICVPTDAIGAAAGTAVWGGITGTLTDQLDLKAALDTKPGEAPTTGLSYARKSNAWEPVVSFPEAPNDGKQYGRQAQSWTEIVGGGGGIPEAPSDGQLYGRKDAAWAVVPSGGGGSGAWVDTIGTDDIATKLTAPAAGGNGTALVQVTKVGVGKTAAIEGYNGANLRWRINLGDEAAEGAGTAGSDYTLQRFNNTGVLIDTPLKIARDTGITTVTQLQSQYITAAAANTEIAVYGHNTIGAWPTINGGLVVARSSGSGNYSAGSVSCYSGTGNTGVVLADGALAWASVSDERLKTIINEVVGGLDVVSSWRPVRYRLNTDGVTARARIGFTAQSILPSAPEAVNEIPVMDEFGQATADSRYTLTPTDLLPHMVNAIKELKTQLDAAKARISALEPPPPVGPFDSGFSNGFGG